VRRAIPSPRNCRRAVLAVKGSLRRRKRALDGWGRSEDLSAMEGMRGSGMALLDRATGAERHQKRETNQDHAARRLPGPADGRLSDRDPTPEPPFLTVSGLAENTNSIMCDGPHRPEATNG
jgi:hypothetical protein